MKTAVDTNVFVALFSGDADASAAAQAALEEARAGGPLGISPAVYAELVAGRDEAFVDTPSGYPLRDPRKACPCGQEARASSYYLQDNLPTAQRSRASGGVAQRAPADRNTL